MNIRTPKDNTATVFAFLIPHALRALNQPEFYFSYFWPLKYDYFYPQTLADVPLYFALYTVLGSLIAAPILAVFYGKRWYCSWVCGCGGLANTFGDPWRHLTSKSTKSWRFEQLSIHLVLALAVATTFLIGLDSLIGSEHHVRPGDDLTLQISLDKVHLFDPETTLALDAERNEADIRRGGAARKEEAAAVEAPATV